MDLNICIFEDSFSKNFHPLSYTRPVFDLRCGIMTLKEKIIYDLAPGQTFLFVRDYLKNDQKIKNKNQPVNEVPLNTPILFLNGRIVMDDSIKDALLDLDENQLLKCDDNVIAAKLTLKNPVNNLEELENLFGATNITGSQFKIDLAKYPWELVNRNGAEIVKDFKRITKNHLDFMNGQVYHGVNLVNDGNIFTGKGSKIKPGVVLDAEEGPIYIGEDVTIFPNAVIEGPCYIGRNSKIKVGAKIYENTSIGPVCKVGGEVEESIIHSYSNKQHDGFLGHAYLGSWVNLGADTNNSDLKNNYGNVKVFINDEQVDTSSTFVGLTMGDHSKSGINTMFNTGTVVGVSCNIYGGNFPPKYIPSFSWGGSDGFSTYKLEKSMEVAKKVMARRNVEFTNTDKELFEKIFQLTLNERSKRNY